MQKAKNGRAHEDNRSNRTSREVKCDETRHEIPLDMDTRAGRSKTSATGDRNLQMEEGRAEGRTGQHSSRNNAVVATAEHVEGRTHQPSGSSSSSSGEGSSDVAMDVKEKKQPENMQTGECSTETRSRQEVRSESAQAEHPGAPEVDEKKDKRNMVRVVMS